MAGIFLSYRRDDSGGHAGRLADDLKQAFAGDQVWRDIEAIEAGADFVDAIGKAVSSCSVLLAMIGPRWLEAKNSAGNRRLDDPSDFVRLEISAALERGVRVIPVLVGGAAMPAEPALPEVLRPLARRQAHELTDKRWDYDVGQLFGALEKLPGLSRRQTASPPVAPASPPASSPHHMPGWAKGLIGVIAAIAVLAIIGNMMNDPEPPPAAEDYVARVAEQMKPASPPETPETPATPNRLMTEPAAVANEPAPPPARATPPAPALASVAGTWMSPEGDGVYIEQHGAQLAIVAADAAQQHGFMGQGAVQGRQVQMVLMHLATGLNMEIRATVSEDGRRMQGTAHMAATGATDNFVWNRQ